MRKTEKKEQMNFSIWDSVVNERIVQYEKLEGKYRRRGHRIEELITENEKLKVQMEEMTSKCNAILNDSLTLKNEICEMRKSNSNLQQQIYNLEHSTSWKVTKPIRYLLDMIKKKG